MSEENKTIKDLESYLKDFDQKRLDMVKLFSTQLPDRQIQFHILDKVMETLRMTTATQLKSFRLMKKASDIAKKAGVVAWVSLGASCLSGVLSVVFYCLNSSNCG